MTLPKQSLFDLSFTAITQREAVNAIQAWLTAEDSTPHLVVTPNVHFTLLQQRNPAFRAVLNAASLCVVDGRPIWWASRLLGRPLPEVITGSDLVPAVFQRAAEESRDTALRVYLLGAAPGVASKAAIAIESTYLGITVCGVDSPPMGFERDDKECERICQAIRRSGAQLLIIGLGAPKQEFWAHRYLSYTGVRVAICAGATIDFLAGEKPRAPRWINQIGLEWLFRVLSEPRRLAGRYARDGLALPGLIVREWWKLRKQG
ncbi:MAG TPA: WecB/TagA/CpsF family glycosyltransferase [Limnobacter sp.]|uniref:WecB/TagA/CpsF family glycosyltransferase n=1 Tax=Limnobacter sp. TaxID=2003368 RepID=UPI002EDB8306